MAAVSVRSSIDSLKNLRVARATEIALARYFEQVYYRTDDLP